MKSIQPLRWYQSDTSVGQGLGLRKEGTEDLILIFKKDKAYEVPRLVKFIKTESRMLVARVLEERGMGSCLMGLEFCKMTESWHL